MTGMGIKSDKKKNKSERHIIGPIIGLIVLALICYWQYITILDNDVEVNWVAYVISTACVPLAAILWSILGIGGLLTACFYTNAENYAAGNITGEQYAMRDFVRDDLERKYRKEYDDALAELDNNDEDDD